MRMSIFWLPVVLGAMAPLASAQSPSVDLLLRGGTVVDGRGTAPRVTDIGITGDRITFIGDAAPGAVRAGRTIDVRGLIVAPGYIDPHAHELDDLSSTNASRRANAHYLLQGVTTVITGNDGSGPARIGDALVRWQQQGIGTNAALLVGHGSVRRSVLGMSSASPTVAQLDSMRALVSRAMDEGALGLSTGLY